MDALEQLTIFAHKYSGFAALIIIAMIWTVRYFIKDKIRAKEKQLDHIMDAVEENLEEMQKINQTLYGVEGNGETGLVKKIDRFVLDTDKRMDDMAKQIARIEGKISK